MIIRAYGGRDMEDEIHLRLRGGHTTTQDAERDRLRTRYQAYKAKSPWPRP